MTPQGNVFKDDRGRRGQGGLSTWKGGKKKGDESTKRSQSGVGN